MAVTFTVSLANIIKELTLETLYMPGSPEEVLISSRDVSRPGLEFTGFFEYYDNTRVLIIGNTEHAFLARFSPDELGDIRILCLRHDGRTGGVSIRQGYESKFPGTPENYQMCIRDRLIRSAAMMQTVLKIIT